MAVSDPPLLVAGPSAIDGEGLWSGSGFLLAAAAAARVPVQLWSRPLGPLEERHLAVLERRGIDPAGCDADGAADDRLPSTQPVSAEGLGAVALVDLAPRECRRALRCLEAIGIDERCPLLVAWTGAVERGAIEAFAPQATLVVIGAAAATAAFGLDDPAAAADALIAAGATAAALTAGPLGGLFAYKQKRATWSAVPGPNDHPSGWARAVFAGVAAGDLARLGRIDWRNGKRALATAGAFAYEGARRPRPKRLMTSDWPAVEGAFMRVRRTTKA